MKVTHPSSLPAEGLDMLKLMEVLFYRDEFLMMASHELKTPLTSLKLRAQSFKRQEQKNPSAFYSIEKVDRLVEEMERQSKRLSKLIDVMLDVSRLRSGTLRMLKSPCCFSDILRDVMKSYHLAPSSKVHVNLFGDPYRLAQVCDTLISNALKFGGGAPIEVSIRKTKKGFNLLVKDQGIGISEEDQGRIFERFSRGVATSQVEGMGLSLYLAREIIEAHGGSISVKSKLQHGSTFKVSFKYLENL